MEIRKCIGYFETNNNPFYINLLKKKIYYVIAKTRHFNQIDSLLLKEQQEYIDLYGDLQISQSLLEELESRRLGFSIPWRICTLHNINCY